MHSQLSLRLKMSVGYQEKEILVRHENQPFGIKYPSYTLSSVAAWGTAMGRRGLF